MERLLKELVEAFTDLEVVDLQLHVRRRPPPAP